MQSAIVDLLQKMVGLPLRAPTGLEPSDHPWGNVFRRAEPFKADKETCQYADTIWQTHLQHLARELPEEAGMLTSNNLVCSSYLSLWALQTHSSAQGIMFMSSNEAV